ncbi:arginine--tRNA ligase [Flammeovirga kamogawensis]|uniref:Arginine--tRNA ligase n=1 Tax=Flammeovirga kamogawensis TaxID=373891 RepID=A0ABX8GY06_9BACT|nr:arginine--tRNA ligase [Flammeovirga kamogawensis]MBB6458922.1 arginyl-tRNA synthetase [Flammeovirga kamogawensis]QWG08500.1 arginine--tRNA ligase [Flammeovirga kamogawensis]
MEQQIINGIAEAVKELYGIELPTSRITLQPTKKEFDGALTFVTFSLTKQLGKNPVQIGEEIGAYLKENISAVSDFNVVKGFLNLVISNTVWVETLAEISQDDAYGRVARNGEKVMVEYSSPNTNKPLHLGHLRNNFLGHSVSLILDAAGYDVQKVNLVNDRGIHICKSMLAYTKFGNGETPSATLKGDKLVGNYYVAFDKHYKVEIKNLIEEKKGDYPSLVNVEDLKALKAEIEAKGASKKNKIPLTDEEKVQIKDIKALFEYAEKNAPLLLEAQEMLRKWEAGDEETVALWKKMNDWVYAGFAQSYEMMGVEFDNVYYESQTYLLGKDIVQEGLDKGIFFKKENGSVWIDLKKEKLDEKLVLRGDGTAVYMTQDMGTADLKYKDFGMTKSVYVVGNEQDYHFKVLQAIMKHMGRSYADGIFHLSYGMVELPEGKMKSREGTVVDADDLIQEMIDTAQERTEESGKIDGFTEDEAKVLFKQLALGALKYYLLKVDPKKTMLFNPKDSIDFQGDTGVYIQYNHAKIQALLRRADKDGIDYSAKAFEGLTDITAAEADLVALLGKLNDKISESADAYAPSIIANYAFDVAKQYSKVYSESPIFNEEDAKKKAFRIALSKQSADAIRIALQLIGVQAPSRM